MTIVSRFNIRAISISILLGIWGFACDEDKPSPDDIVAAELFEGRWRTAGTWDLSGPFSDGVTVGDLVAEALVIETVKAAGVPSALEDETESLLKKTIGDNVADYVDSRMPQEMMPGGIIYNTLAIVFATVDVETEMVLNTKQKDSGRVEGHERILRISFDLPDTSVVAMLDAVPLVGIEADISGRGKNETSVILNNHTFEIRFDALVVWVLENELAINLTELTQSIDDAVNCEGILSDIIGDALSFDVMSQDVTISQKDVAAACDVVRTQTREKAAGLFRKNTGVVIGGSLEASPRKSLPDVNAFISGPTYAGKLETFSEYLAPNISITMIGERI